MLERSCKDLQRQTVSLERLRVVLGENVDKAFRRMNEVFRELHDQSVVSLSSHCIVIIGSRPSDHYFCSVCLSVCLSVTVLLLVGLDFLSQWVKVD